MQLSNQEAINIPVIDISVANSQIAEQLINAVVQWGFVFIKAHGSGFTSDIIDNMFQIVSSRHSAFSMGVTNTVSINHTISLASSFNRLLKIRSVIRSPKMSGSISPLFLLSPLFLVPFLPSVD